MSAKAKNVRRVLVFLASIPLFQTGTCAVDADTVRAALNQTLHEGMVYGISNLNRLYLPTYDFEELQFQFLR